MLTKFYRINESVDPKNITTDDLQEIISEIEYTVNRNGYIKFSNGWLAGLLNELRSDGSNARKLVRMLDYGTLKDENQQKTAINIKSVFDILTKYGFARKYGNDYRLSDDKAKNSLLSVMRQQLGTSNTATRKSEEEKRAKQIHSAEYTGADEFVNSMPEDLKNAMELFNLLDPEEIAYLNNLLNMRNEAKAKKTGYTDKILNDIGRNNPTVLALVNYGFIDESTGRLNLDVINLAKSLFSVEDGNGIFKLRTHMPTAYNLLKRLAAVEALQENEFIRQNVGSELAKKAEDIFQSLSDSDKDALLHDKMFPRFQNAGLLDITKNNLGKQVGKWTPLGRGVKLLVRNNKATFEELAKDISMATGRDENTPDLAPSTPEKRSRLLRKRQLDRKQGGIIKTEGFITFINR